LLKQFISTAVTGDTEKRCRDMFQFQQNICFVCFGIIALLNSPVSCLAVYHVHTKSYLTSNQFTHR